MVNGPRLRRGLGCVWIQTLNLNFQLFLSHQPVIRITFQSHYTNFNPNLQLWKKLNQALDRFIVARSPLVDLYASGPPILKTPVKKKSKIN